MKPIAAVLRLQSVCELCLSHLATAYVSPARIDEMRTELEAVLKETRFIDARPEDVRHER